MVDPEHGTYFVDIFKYSKMQNTCVVSTHRMDTEYFIGGDDCFKTVNFPKKIPVIDTVGAGTRQILVEFI